MLRTFWKWLNHLLGMHHTTPQENRPMSARTFTFLARRRMERDL